jgi:molecular chaperone DnaK
MTEDRTIGIGIDLGTSNCAVSVVSIKSGRFDFNEARDLAGTSEIPSVVYVDTDGSRKYGGGALSHSQRLPDAERVLTNLKLLLRNNEPISLPGLEDAVTPVELTRGMLSFLKRCCAQTFNIPCENVVITRPANAEFDVDYRHQIREAVLGQEPLFDAFSTLEEPDSVLLSLGSLESLIDKKVLVFDMGGGTLDITIRSVEERDGRPYLELLAIEGSNIAGRHLTQAVADHLFGLARENGLIPVDLSKDDLGALMRLNYSSIDRAKRTVSGLAFQAKSGDKRILRQRETVNFLPHNPSYGPFGVNLTVADFNKILKVFIEESLETAKKAVASAGLLPGEIDSYYIVGGGSQIPGLSEALTDLFGRNPESLIGDFGTIEPRLAVARGAAVWALTRPTENDSDYPSTGPVLERKLPYAISQVVNSGEGTVPIFDEGTLLPAESAQRFYAPVGLGKITVKLVRGVGIPSDCVALSDTIIDLVEPAAQGAQALEFSHVLSLDGELTLLVKDWKGRELPVVRFMDLL